MFVAGAGGSAAAAARADETEQRMLVRKRRNAGGPAPTGARVNGARRDEAPSTSANAREVASLNQAPDGRTRDAKGTPRLLNGEHGSCHVPIVSQSSHRLSRLVRLELVSQTFASRDHVRQGLDGLELSHEAGLAKRAWHDQTTRASGKMATPAFGLDGNDPKQVGQAGKIFWIAGV